MNANENVCVIHRLKTMAHTLALYFWEGGGLSGRKIPKATDERGKAHTHTPPPKNTHPPTHTHTHTTAQAVEDTPDDAFL